MSYWRWVKDVEVPYMPCSCGYVSWDGIKCEKGHSFGYVYTPRKRQHRYSGDSDHQEYIGGFQQSGRS